MTASPRTVRLGYTGKLLQYVVADGTHVTAGDAIAEVEAMKMVGPFFVEATGVLTHVMVRGCHPEAGLARFQRRGRGQWDAPWLSCSRQAAIFKAGMSSPRFPWMTLRK